MEIFIANQKNTKRVEYFLDRKKKPPKRFFILNTN